MTAPPPPPPGPQDSLPQSPRPATPPRRWAGLIGPDGEPPQDTRAGRALIAVCIAGLCVAATLLMSQSPDVGAYSIFCATLRPSQDPFRAWRGPPLRPSARIAA